MICIIPLAGPDFLHPEYGFRPLFSVGGRPLLEVAIESRPWRKNKQLLNGDLVFVIRDVKGVNAFREFLAEQWPGCRIVTIPSLTQGALFSALSGGCYARPGQPLIIDLVDILFECDFDFTAPWHLSCGAVAPVFISSEKCYSYLREENGVIVEIAEKRVISDKASTGTYVFRSSEVFLSAAAHSFSNYRDFAHSGSLFVSSALSGVLLQGLNIIAPISTNVNSISKLHHE